MEKTGSGWGWGGDDIGEWGKERRMMARQGGRGCQDFEPQVEGGRRSEEEEHLLPCDSPPPFAPLPLLPQ